MEEGTPSGEGGYQVDGGDPSVWEKASTSPHTPIVCHLE
jgi:hypothetical protein